MYIICCIIRLKVLTCFFFWSDASTGLNCHINPCCLLGLKMKLLFQLLMNFNNTTKTQKILNFTSDKWDMYVLLCYVYVCFACASWRKSCSYLLTQFDWLHENQQLQELWDTGKFMAKCCFPWWVIHLHFTSIPPWFKAKRQNNNTNSRVTVKTWFRTPRKTQWFAAVAKVSDLVQRRFQRSCWAPVAEGKTFQSKGRVG